MEQEASFGRWLKQRRKAHDITQDELAARVGCTVETIRKIEADLRRPSRAIAEGIAREVATGVEEREAVIRAARALGPTDLPLPMPPTSRPHNLPAPATPLIGRERQVMELCTLLGQPAVRLLTVTGPGGIGKTRLALEVARRLVTAFAEGVWWVPLAAIADPELVIPALALALGVHEAGGQPLDDRLRAFLRDQELLVVLDNVEQVVGVAQRLASLLQAAPRLKLLVTSRIVLHIAAEHVWQAPPLTLPPARTDAPETLVTRYEACALFTERARAVQSDFIVTAAMAPSVAEICRRLDGLPLAIELAAARSKLFTPPALLKRLTEGAPGRLALLTGGARDAPDHQQALRATIAWSYDLLAAPEQRLFARLAVFAGGWTVEAAEAICGNLQPGVSERSMGVLDQLQALLDHSLVQQEPDQDGEPRFTMLETIREYAQECLLASGDVAQLQRRHADYFVVLAESPEAQTQGMTRHTVWDRLEREHANFRAALAWSRTEGKDETGLRLVVALAAFWRARGHLREGHTWLRDILRRGTGDAVRPSTTAYRTLRATALDWLGSFAIFLGDLPDAQQPHEESLALFRDVGDHAGVAQQLNMLGMLFQMRGDYERAGAFLQEGLVRWRQLGDRDRIAQSLFFLGTLAYSMDNHEQAGDLWEESLDLTPADDPWTIASTLAHRAMAALDDGDDERAEASLVRSLTLFRSLGERWQVLLALEVFARLAAMWERQSASARSGYPRAARLFGAAATLRDTLGAPRVAIYQDHYRRSVAVARAQCDECSWEVEWAKGQAMTLEQVICYALEGSNDTTSNQDAHTAQAP